MFTHLQGYSKYDASSWTQATATDYDLAGQATLFVNVKNPQRVSIRTDKDITVKFHSTSNAGISVSQNTTFDMPIDCKKIYITTTESTALKVELWGYNAT